MSRRQLLELGLSRHAIEHRVTRGKLHRVARGVYAVGRPELTREGRWMAAILSCRPRAVLSHASAAALWGLEDRERQITLTVPTSSGRRQRPGLRIHSGLLEPNETSILKQIPVTSAARTLIDLAAVANEPRLESAVNAADKLGLISPHDLRRYALKRSGRTGAPALRALLDPATFRGTDSELEREFLRLVRDTGLPQPQTGIFLNGYKVDFLWPELGLIAETDGLRYHRTARQQGRDRRRDQVHATAGLTTLRFTRYQVVNRREQVVGTLRAMIRRLGG